MRSICRYGPHKEGLSDVAGELDVSRRTAYRLYKSREDPQLTGGAAAADNHPDRLAAPVTDLSKPGGAVIGVIAHTFETPPLEPFPVQLLTTGWSEAFLEGVTSCQAMAFGRSMLAGMSVDWAASCCDANELDGLEFRLRVLQLRVLDPRPKPSRAELCAFPQRGVAPAVHATTRTA